MKLLYTLLTILTVGIASAQESELVISQIAHGDNTYTHIKGDDNGAENCFEADAVTSVSTLSMSVNGLAVDIVHIDDVDYSWTGPGAEALALSFKAWDDYNRLYLNRGTQRPARAENIEAILFRCDGWSLDASGQWYVNSEYPGYAYNSVVAPATATDPAIHTPQLVFGYDGSHPNLRLIADGGQRIYVGSFRSEQEAIDGVLVAIDLHMNPITETEDTTTSTATTAVDEWNQGGIQGFLGWSGRYDQTWSNPIYPGYAYNTWENHYEAGQQWFVKVGIYDPATLTWTTIDLQGVATSEANADGVARTYIAENAVVDGLVVPHPLERLAETLAGSVPNRGYFRRSDFTSPHTNPGWVRGDYQNGLTTYVVTAPSRSSNIIEVSWIHTDSRGWGYTNRPNHEIEVPSTIQYISWDGSVHANEADLPAGSHTEIHRYAEGAISIAQEEGVEWAISQLNIFVGRDTSN